MTAGLREDGRAGDGRPRRDTSRTTDRDPTAHTAPTRPAPSTPSPLPPAVRVSARSKAKTGAALSDPHAMLGPVENRSVSPVFVGRTEELATLNDAPARAAAG